MSFLVGPATCLHSVSGLTPHPRVVPPSIPSPRLVSGHLVRLGFTNPAYLLYYTQVPVVSRITITVADPSDSGVVHVLVTGFLDDNYSNKCEQSV